MPLYNVFTNKTEGLINTPQESKRSMSGIPAIAFLHSSATPDEHHKKWRCKPRVAKPCQLWESACFLAVIPWLRPGIPPCTFTVIKPPFSLVGRVAFSHSSRYLMIGFLFRWSLQRCGY